jgi:hypothetical protein
MSIGIVLCFILSCWLASAAVLFLLRRARSTERTSAFIAWWLPALLMVPFGTIAIFLGMLGLLATLAGAGDAPR